MFAVPFVGVTLLLAFSFGCARTYMHPPIDTDGLGAPLESLSYEFESAVYVAGAPIFDNIATVIGGSPEHFFVSPALPVGIVLDETSGLISGLAPDAEIPVTVYVVEASNATSRIEATVEFEILSGFVVNRADDAGEGLAADVGNGYCSVIPGATDNAACTLRAAVQETNALPGRQAILVPDQTYALASPLDITDEVVVQGQSVDGVVLDGGMSTAVLTIAGGVLSARRFTATNGTAVDGAGLYLNGGTFALRECAFRGNVATDTGGAMSLRVSDAEASLDRCALTGNSAGVEGGAIKVDEWATLDIRRSEIADNESPLSIVAGHPQYTLIHVEHSRIHHNTCADGSIVWGGASFISSTIHHNEGAAAAFHGESASSELVNTTVAYNHATGVSAKGGGLALNVGITVLFNSAVIGNHSAWAGGGLGGHSGSQYFVQNSVIAFNSADSALPDCKVDGVIVSRGYNIAPAECGLGAVTDLVGVNPALAGDLTAHGGWVPTFALLPTSPAIDGVLDNSCPATDARGMPRPVDGDGDGVARCDIGPFERGGDD